MDEGVVRRRLGDGGVGLETAEVKTHLTRVFREIGVTDRTRAALWAEREGLGPR